MTHDFEIWLGANKHLINADATGLFEDSLRCYKNDIDRPAYLLAYQGMMVHIREIIKAGNMPKDFPLEDWKRMQKGLNDANSWDNICFDAIMRKEKKHDDVVVPAVLCISCDVRREFEHWRNLRNVCVHYKDYCFVKAHTLTLYAFVIQNLLGITVEGGMMTLLGEFEVFFDPNKTPPNKSWQPLMDKIPTMVMPEQVHTFLHGIRRMIVYKTGNFPLFLHELYQGSKTDVKEFVASYIKSDDDLLETYISEYPHSVAALLKKEEVYGVSKLRVPYMRNSVNVMAALVQTGMIEKDNYEEVFSKLIDTAYEHNSYIGSLMPEDAVTLGNAGFFSIIIQRYLNAGYMTSYNNYCKTNYSMSFWTSVFWNMPINKEFVKAVCEVFCESRKPLALENFIADEYLEDKDIHAKFFEIAERERYKVPRVFQGFNGIYMNEM